MSGESGKSTRSPLSYSIWLMPSGNEKNQLKARIQSLGSNFEGPLFEPHVTLVGGFLGKEKELLKKIETISKRISPFKLFFDGVAYLNEFFRSLFLIVKFNPQLIAARKIACTELDWEDEDYLPHLSLIYGHFTENQKAEMALTVGSIPVSYIVNSIYLAYNDEINLKWRVIKIFQLTK